MKEYFSHDYNARGDRKLVNLLMVKKLEGVGAYWCILEMLYENEGILPTEYERIAFELRTDNNLIKSVINDFELFIVDSNTFYSESVNSRLKIRTDKSDKARENVAKRWDKYKGNTTVLQTNNDLNTIKVKESKEKDIKVKENKEEIKLPFISDNFIKKWNTWKEFRKKEHKFNYKSSISEQAALNKLAELSNQSEITAIEIIDQSIANGWQGLFKIKKESETHKVDYNAWRPAEG